MTTAQIDARALPRPIRRGTRADRPPDSLVGTVARLWHRNRVTEPARGLGHGGRFLLGVASFGTVGRGIWIGWISAGSLALLAFGVLPLLRRRNWVDLAAVAEAGQPEFGERLAGAVDLLGGFAIARTGRAR